MLALTPLSSDLRARLTTKERRFVQLSLADLYLHEQGTPSPNKPTLILSPVLLLRALRFAVLTLANLLCAGLGPAECAQRQL